MQQQTYKETNFAILKSFNTEFTPLYYANSLRWPKYKYREYNFTNRNNTKLLYFNCILIWLQEQGKSNIIHAVTPCSAFGEVGQK